MSAVLPENDMATEAALKQRRERGGDHNDEVWQGAYMMAPAANDDHQRLESRLCSIFEFVLGWDGRAKVRPGVNISDRVDDWRANYRVPDIAVFLPGTAAVNHQEFWYGGPDFLVEILSPQDRSAEKLSFYHRVGVREVLFIERDPHGLLLHSRTAEGWSVTASAPDQQTVLPSMVLPFTFQCLSGEAGSPRFLVEAIETRQRWEI